MATEDEGEERTIAKVMKIISCLDERGPLGITELATELNMPKSTVHYHLEMLREDGFVVQENQKYKCGLRFLEIGENTRRRIPLFEAALEEMEKLAAETGELVILMVEEQGLGVYLHKEPGENAIDMDSSIGRRACLHDRALGKAILANLPRERVETIIQEHGLRQTTDATLHEESELFDSLEQIREKGVAFNYSEAVEGLRGVAVPILTDDGAVFGSLSIAGPSKRLEGERFTKKFPNRLSQSKNVIELTLRNNL